MVQTVAVYISAEPTERCDDLDLREVRIWFSRIMETVEGVIF